MILFTSFNGHVSIINPMRVVTCYTQDDCDAMVIAMEVEPCCRSGDLWVMTDPDDKKLVSNEMIRSFHRAIQRSIERGLHHEIEFHCHRELAFIVDRLISSEKINDSTRAVRELGETERRSL